MSKNCFPTEGGIKCYGLEVKVMPFNDKIQFEIFF
jgi:hypothetical protein